MTVIYEKLGESIGPCKIAGVNPLLDFGDRFFIFGGISVEWYLESSNIALLAIIDQLALVGWDNLWSNKFCFKVFLELLSLLLILSFDWDLLD